MKLKLYNFLETTEVLGPFTRFALWTQGCPFSCKGCMTPDSQPFDRGDEYEIKKLEQLILCNNEIEGITITGGEPFVQVEPLIMLIENIRKKRDLGVIVYTGYQLKEINEDLSKQKLLKHIDILIDGQYIDSLNDDMALRGSSNQHIYQLTKRYSDIFDKYYHRKERNIELYFNKEEFVISGIPKKNRLEKLNKRG